MRKHILVGLLLCLSLNLMAQDSQWFAQANFTWNAWYGVGEKSLVAPFHKFPGGGGDGHTGWGISLAGGRWMTSVIGLRTKLNLWQMGTKSEDGVKADKYWTLNEQVMFNSAVGTQSLSSLELHSLYRSRSLSQHVCSSLHQRYQLWHSEHLPFDAQTGC